MHTHTRATDTDTREGNWARLHGHAESARWFRVTRYYKETFWPRVATRYFRKRFPRPRCVLVRSFVRSFVGSTRSCVTLSYEEGAEVREGNARTRTQRQFINDHGRPVIISVVNTGRTGASARVTASGSASAAQRFSPFGIGRFVAAHARSIYTSVGSLTRYISAVSSRRHR